MVGHDVDSSKGQGLLELLTFFTQASNLANLANIANNTL